MVHSVREYLTFVRQGIPALEPFRLLNLDEGMVDVPLHSPTDAALARMAIDHAGEYPEDALVVEVMEDDEHPHKVAYAERLDHHQPVRVPDGWRVELRHPPTEELTEVTVRDVRGRDTRYAASLGLEHPEEQMVATLAARVGLDYPSYQRLAFCDHLAISQSARFLVSATPTGSA